MVTVPTRVAAAAAGCTSKAVQLTRCLLMSSIILDTSEVGDEGDNGGAEAAGRGGDVGGVDGILVVVPRALLSVSMLRCFVSTAMRASSSLFCSSRASTRSLSLT